MHIHYVLILLLVVAVAFDLKHRSIPNALTLGSTVVGLIVSAHYFGWLGFELAFFGAVIAACVGWLFWSAGLIGGGDQKLLAVAGSFLWYPLITDALVYIGVLGGLLAILWTFSESYINGSKMLTVMKYSHIPYSLAILLGTLVVLF